MNSRHIAMSLSAVLLTITACSGLSPNTGNTASGRAHIYTVDGYPLDRTLHGFIDIRSNLNAIVLLRNPHVSRTAWVRENADGSRTLSKAQSAPLGPGSDTPPPIARLVDATVVSDFSSDPGQAAPSEVLLSGGTIGDTTVIGGPEVTVGAGALSTTGTLLVAGQRVTVDGKPAVDPWFVYRVDPDGVAHSLLESAGSELFPSFRLSDVEQLLLRH